MKIAGQKILIRALAVKVATKRLPVFPFSGFDLYHQFRNDAFYDLYNLLKVRKTAKWEVVLLHPLPQTLYIASHKILCESTLALSQGTCRKLDRHWLSRTSKWPVSRVVDFIKNAGS